jgi:hypothetical protein
MICLNIYVFRMIIYSSFFCRQSYPPPNSIENCHCFAKPKFGFSVLAYESNPSFPATAHTLLFRNLSWLFWKSWIYWGGDRSKFASTPHFNLLLLLLFFFLNVDMQASLNMPRLIPRTLKLTIIQASNDPEVYKTRTGKQDQNLTSWAISLRVSNTSISETSLELKLNTLLCFLLKNILK